MPPINRRLFHFALTLFSFIVDHIYFFFAIDSDRLPIFVLRNCMMVAAITELLFSSYWIFYVRGFGFWGFLLRLASLAYSTVHLIFVSKEYNESTEKLDMITFFIFFFLGAAEAGLAMASWIESPRAPPLSHLEAAEEDGVVLTISSEEAPADGPQLEPTEPAVDAPPSAAEVEMTELAQEDAPPLAAEVEMTELAQEDAPPLTAELQMMVTAPPAIELELTEQAVDAPPPAAEVRLIVADQGDAPPAIELEPTDQAADAPPPAAELQMIPPPAELPLPERAQLAPRVIQLSHIVGTIVAISLLAAVLGVYVTIFLMFLFLVLYLISSGV